MRLMVQSTHNRTQIDFNHTVYNNRFNCWIKAKPRNCILAAFVLSSTPLIACVSCLRYVDDIHSKHCK